MDDVDSGSDAARTKAAIEHIQEKIHKIMDQIKDEQSQKEGNDSAEELQCIQPTSRIASLCADLLYC